ncbi:hypothetical protein JCM8097_003554 [Rhodosporidiobolus ruineniae]
MVVELIYTPPSLMTYTLILRGERFELSHSQVTTDSPNYLQGRFLGGSQERTISADRKPDVFRTFILEHLSGYDIFPLEPFKGMSKKQVAKAVLVEAEFFKLKDLIYLARAALEKQEPTMLWRLNGMTEYMDFNPEVIDFSALTRKGPISKAVLNPPAGVYLQTRQYRFENLQCTIIPIGDGATSLSVLFLGPGQHARVQQNFAETLEYKPIDVEYWYSGSTQASVTVDGAKTTLEVLLQWAAYPSATTAKIATLKPLNEIFHPEVIPSSRRYTTLVVRSAVGYWARNKLRLQHLTIFSEDQGFSHLDKA